jgi:hypothetical protein
MIYTSVIFCLLVMAHVNHLNFKYFPIDVLLSVVHILARCYIYLHSLYAFKSADLHLT